MLRLIRNLLLTAILFAPMASRAMDADDPAYAVLLKSHVHWAADGHSSSVDYAGLQRDKAALKTLLSEWSAVKRSEFDGWSRPQQMAFLINAYNGFTLELILTRYPDLKSIRDLGSILRSPWKQPFFQLLGEQRALDWIEHEQLRPVYRDARVHFAINCASIGCPALRPEPYSAQRLGAQLDDQQARFLGDRSRNHFDSAGKRLTVSPIFKWFAEDFSRDQGKPEAWLAARADQLADTAAERARLKAGDFKLDYADYDWTLNLARGKP